MTSKSQSQFVEIDEHGVAHSIVGASSMHRVDQCPRSVQLHKDLLASGWKAKSSPQAAAGTAIHAMVEDMLLNDLDPKDMQGVFHGPTKYTVTAVDVKNLAWVKKTVNKFMKMPEWKDAELHLETKVGLPSVHEEAFGTTDISLIHPFGAALILDYKNGTQKVSAKGNRQIAYYGIGIQDTFGCTDIFCGILQPNVSKKVELYELSIDDMEDERIRLKNSIDAAMSEDAEIKDGSHCFFCPAKQARVCPLIKAKEEEEKKGLLLPTDNAEPVEELEWTPIKIDSSSLTPVDELTPQQRANLLLNKKLIEDYLKQVYEYSASTFEDNPLDGFTFVDGRKGARQWAEGAESVLGENVKKDLLYDTVLASPSTLEKRLGKEFDKIPSDLIVQKDGQKKLVPIAEPSTPKLKKPKTK